MNKKIYTEIIKNNKKQNKTKEFGWLESAFYSCQPKSMEGLERESEPTFNLFLVTVWVETLVAAVRVWDWRRCVGVGAARAPWVWSLKMKIATEG